MIEKTEDLGLSYKESPEELEKILQDKLGIGFTEMGESLSKYVQEHAVELAQDFFTMIPYKDYSKLIEGEDKMTEFLQKEAAKIENWQIAMIDENRDTKGPKMLTFIFYNKAVDEGDSLIGYVYVNYDGKLLRTAVVSDP